MFTEDVGGIQNSISVVEGNDLGGNSLMDMVKGKGIVMLVKLVVLGDHRTINDSLLITKNINFGINGHIPRLCRVLWRSMI
jgi:hypothetical protein